MWTIAKCVGAAAAALLLVACAAEPEVVTETVEVEVEVLPESCAYVADKGSAMLTLVDDLLGNPDGADADMVIFSMDTLLVDYDWDLHRECVDLLNDD